MRNIAYVEVTSDYSETGTPELRGRTQGCDCCSTNIEATTRAEVLNVLNRWERELTETLEKVNALRAVVSKWTDPVGSES